jgi:hypothetical protein
LCYGKVNHADDNDGDDNEIKKNYTMTFGSISMICRGTLQVIAGTYLVQPGDG